jgi:hypothetical protein
MKFEIQEQCDIDGNEVKMLVLIIDRVIVTPARYNDESDRQPLIDILGEQGANDIVTATSTDYILAHPKALQIIIGEIPCVKMLQIMTMTGQVTGCHGHDVWYSAKTDASLHEALNTGAPLALLPVEDHDIEFRYNGAEEKFIGMTDLTAAIGNILMHAFLSHQTTIGRPEPTHPIFLGIKLKARVVRDRVGLTAIEDDVSTGIAYRHGVCS